MNHTHEPSRHSIEVAHSFLQTVVVVDDRALNPVVGKLPDDDVQPSVAHRGVVGGLRIPDYEVGDQHDLDAKRISQAFARHGLVCGLLSPSSSESLTDELLTAARRADLVVLDWVLDRDEGRAAMELLERLLQRDSVPGAERLRAIAIYTGQRELRAIADKLKVLLDNHFLGHVLELHDDGLAMTKGPVRLAVLAKENVNDLDESIEGRRISLDDLPHRLEREFAALTEGLVTSVALGSLAALRDDTHRILKLLGPALDAGFLGHRTSLPEAADAESHALELVSSELHSVLEDHEVGKNVAAPVLNEWLERFRSEESELGHLIDSSKLLTRAQVSRAMEIGLGSDSSLVEIATMREGISKNYLQNKVKIAATKLFSESEDEAEEADAVFANRVILRTIYSTPARFLQLGTIVRRSSSEYLLCVQPLCDCVRLKCEVRAFPFVQLGVTNGDSYSMRIGNGQGSNVYLKLSSRPADVVMARFKPRVRETTVVARQSESESGVDVFDFVDTRSNRYRWVAQLKPEFAQKTVGDLAAAFARVAVNEAELRRLG